MQLLDHPIVPQEPPARVLDSMLRASGYDARDFEIAEHETDFVDLLGQSGRVVTVRRRFDRRGTPLLRPAPRPPGSARS